MCVWYMHFALRKPLLTWRRVCVGVAGKERERVCVCIFHTRLHAGSRCFSGSGCVCERGGGDSVYMCVAPAFCTQEPLLSWLRVCVCVWKRERGGERVRVLLMCPARRKPLLSWLRACVCVRVCMCVCVCVTKCG